MEKLETANHLLLNSLEANVSHNGKTSQETRLDRIFAQTRQLTEENRFTPSAAPLEDRLKIIHQITENATHLLRKKTSGIMHFVRTVFSPAYRKEMQRATFEYQALISQIHSAAEVMKKFNVLPDLSIRVGGQLFHLHRDPLVKQSGFFQAILQSPMNNRARFVEQLPAQEITLPEIPPKTFELLLNYMYTGKLLLPNDPKETLLIQSSAEFLQLPLPKFPPIHEIASLEIKYKELLEQVPGDGAAIQEQADACKAKLVELYYEQGIRTMQKQEYRQATYFSRLSRFYQTDKSREHRKKALLKSFQQSFEMNPWLQKAADAKAAEKGNPYAHMAMALQCLNKSDLKQAEIHLRAAMDKGLADAKSMLGRIYLDYPYYNGAGCLELMENAAKTGSLFALRNLAHYYEFHSKSWNPPEGEPNPITYYRQAAEQGDPMALAALSEYYLLHSTEPKPSLALDYYKKALDKGYARNPSSFSYERWFRFLLETKEENRASHNLDNEQLHNLPRAKVWMPNGWRVTKEGCLFDNALEIDKELEKRQIEVIREGAKRYHPAALAALGECYERGRGVEENRAEAMEYFQQAAEEGSVAGELGLGRSYDFLGESNQALIHYQKAATHPKATAEEKAAAELAINKYSQEIG